MCGLHTLEDHIVPRVREAAQRAERPAPRIVAGLPLCVTDEPERARAFAAEKLSVYAAMPSYRAMLDREGAEGPADICLIGDEARVGDGLDRLAAIGVTDLRATELDPTPEDRDRTRALLRSRL
jgi:alkanesulfonate monooxygenase SsuD/methylene tetrahydromethanopterin reductase-like flavin-dependent oxidoreductase (luciferase family)